MQLKAALGEQSRWGRRLGVTLIKMGMVEEGHLLRALAQQLDLPVASLAGKRIPDSVIALVPARVALEHGVIPLFTKEGGASNQLYLGMEDPSNLAVLDDLSFFTGMEIHPVMVGPSELGEAIDRYYHGRNGGAPKNAPFRTGDTMDPASLRIVTDDSAHPGTAPAIQEQSIESEIMAATKAPALEAEIDLTENEEPTPPTRPSPPAPVAPAVAPPPAPVATPVQAVEHPVASEPQQAEARVEIPILEPAPAANIPPGLVEDVARAIEETERTRVVAKAIAQLLIKKGLLSLDELQGTITEIKTALGPATTSVE